ncbi:MAG TPA: tetratricopeptide repeat protein [Pirellulales bacterium]|jgi:tetratricopeptide (TPR) repeat protein|nr:tetratricopeptide repeat protein [Pirellulales bacterium]
MARVVVIVVFLLAALWLLSASGLLPEPVAAAVRPILGLSCSLAWPLFFISLWVAPGLYRDLANDLSHFWRRLRTRRHEIEELERKIAHLDKPHHRVQLGNILLAQGRTDRAARLFEEALTGDGESVEAKYKLGLCHFERKRYREAADLLEQVHAVKPDHDYGMAYLRLAEAHDRTGNVERAGHVYATMLRYYPSHAEGSYYYALLCEGRGELDDARRLMRDVVFSVRHSPGFHRRRNRHWLLKAQWWLWRR